MSYVAELAEYSELLFGIVLLAGLYVAHEIGLWIGQRDRRRNGSVPEGVGVIVGGLLGLLAFVLALTLTFANTRFAERRLGALTEANAISTAWIRAQAIGHPRGEEIARLLQEYAKLRLEFAELERNGERLDDINRRSSALQSQMVGHLAVIVRDQPNAASTSLMSALTETFDSATAERFAYAMRLPSQAFWLLVGLGLLSSCMLGYQMGIKKSPLRVLASVLLLGWTIITVAILDLAASRVGSFRTTGDVYRWTLQGFEGGFHMPSAPPVKTP